MKKGKKVLAVTLAATMAMTCLTACGGGSGKNGATEAPTRKAGEAVKVDDAQIDAGLAGLGITAPEKKENNADAEQIALTVWCPAEEKLVMEKLCTEFDESRPEYDIDFTYEFISEADAGNMLMNDPNKSADVLMFGGDQVSSLVDNGSLYDISVLADEVKDLDTKYDANAYKSAIVNDKLYALPFTPNQYFLYYNKSMLSETDVEKLETVMAKDLGADVKNFAMELNNGFYIVSFMQANDVYLFGKDGTQADQCDWNSAGAMEVVNYLNDMVATGKFHNNKEDDAIAEMKNGKVASFVSGSWTSNAVKEALGDNYAVAPLPSINIGGADKYLKPFADYKEIGVNAVTKYPQAAAYLAYFLADEYAQYVRLDSRAYAPTLTRLQEAVLNDEEVDPTVVAAVKQMDVERSHPRPTTSQIANYWTFGATLGSLIYNQDARITDEDQKQSTLDTINKGIIATL